MILIYVQLIESSIHYRISTVDMHCTTSQYTHEMTSHNSRKLINMTAVVVITLKKQHIQYNCRERKVRH